MLLLTWSLRLGWGANIQILYRLLVGLHNLNLRKDAPWCRFCVIRTRRRSGSHPCENNDARVRHPTLPLVQGRLGQFYRAIGDQRAPWDAAVLVVYRARPQG